MKLGSLFILYSYVFIARILLSWFPLSRGGLMETVSNAIYSVTEPILGPLRRTIPPIGMFDLSPMIVIFVLQVLGSNLS